MRPIFQIGQQGKRGERQWRDELRAQGFAARRGQQFAGGPESPDVLLAESDSLRHFLQERVQVDSYGDSTSSELVEAYAALP